MGRDAKKSVLLRDAIKTKPDSTNLALALTLGAGHIHNSYRLTLKGESMRKQRTTASAARSAKGH
jgi:hypothetical protein